jgi:uncharacterized membrane protein YbjE (DUF340 family)
MIGRALGLLVLCFLVGLLLATLGITPRGILFNTWDTIVSVARLIKDLSLWAIPYILLGAVIVVPLALLGLAQRLGRRR